MEVSRRKGLTNFRQPRPLWKLSVEGGSVEEIHVTHCLEF